MKMRNNPVIDRIRAVRREISGEYNHDPKALVAHYRAMEERFKDRILKPATTEAKEKSKNESTRKLDDIVKELKI